MIYKIYSKSGTEKAEFDPGNSTWQNELMGDNMLQLSFTLNEYMDAEVGDYVSIGNTKFVLNDQSRPKINSKQSYEYTLKFLGPESRLKNGQTIAYENGDVNSDVSLIDTPKAQLQFLLNLINDFLGTAYTAGTVIAADPLTADFGSKTYFDALTALANLYSTEWWFDHDAGTLNLSKCITGDRIDLGYGQGLKDLSKDDNSSDSDFWTRLFPKGSTKNIIYDDYGHYRLQLPNNVKYIEKDIDKYGIHDKVEESAFADIFPRFNGTVGTVRSEQKTIDSKEVTIYLFTDTTLTFNPNDYSVAGEVKHVIFKSGDLNSQDFEANWHADSGEWELITQYPTDDTQLPSGSVIPHTGDKYTIYNMKMPSDYYTAAEKEFAAAVETYKETAQIDFAVYTGNTDFSYIEKNNISIRLGSFVRLISDKYFSEGYRDSRVTKITRQLKELNTMEILVSNVIKKGTFTAIQDDISDLKIAVDEQDSKDDLQVLKTYDQTEPSDKNVLSALRAIKEILSRALSKTTNDSASGLITFMLGLVSEGLAKFNKGVVFGDYISGQAGSGGKIDENGRAELRSLTLDDFLEVPELRYNRVQIQVGNNWRAPGGGIIQSVTIDKDSSGNNLMTGTIVLKLTSGEIGKIAVDDICMGVFHDGISATENDAEDYDDGLGNFKFSGFYTTYFRITAITETGSNSIFKYALRATDSSWTQTHHPCAAMHFVGYGNFSDTTRQCSRYSALTYERYLAGVSTWNYQKSNIKAQFGDLSNLSGLGFTAMTGYSAFINNAYFSGKLEQLEEIADWMDIDQSLNGLMCPGQAETVTCKIYDAYGRDVTSSYAQFALERDSGDSASDATWNAQHTNVTNVFQISFNDDLNAKTGTHISTLFNVIATKTDGSTTNNTITFN